jgi:glutaredoxin 3
MSCAAPTLLASRLHAGYGGGLERAGAMAKVIVYTTEWCPFCVRAKALLEHKGVAFEEIDVASDDTVREQMIAASGRRTVPQIFIDEQSIGGFDELYELEQSGQLDTLLQPAS